MRPGVQVREAMPEDLDGLVGLCLEARAEAAVGAQLCSNDADRLRHQLGTLLATPGGHAMVGHVDGDLAGLLLTRVVGPSPFTEDVSLHVEALYVSRSRRRRGLGHALLTAALAVADDAGADQVFAVPLPGSRGVQRFLARLGFAPAAAHRVVTTEVLQRRLAADPVRTGSRRSTGRGLEDLIARRRQVRSATSGPVDLRELPERLAARQVGADPGADREPVATAVTADQSPRRSSISMHVKRAVASRRESEPTTTIS
ncbi:GNAT family N-acetyltransferase [uncultured Cellulomonas sp.]|uniref:GNAT family N-acetyltransferase n=1 Tax=uncultured Cellulomonas sp. TaxID=189682 RepID=UPI0026281968|nr:GNAT family N-acetyltransferase [uncultured Cellulomonas sp.]